MVNDSLIDAMMPSFNLVNSIYDSIRVVFLRIVYMIVPAVVFLIALKAVGPRSRDLLFQIRIPEFLATVGLVLLLIIIVYLIFEFLLFFAKARLAYLNSLTEALKIHKVVGDIRSIGIGNIILWLIFMAILLIVASYLSSLVMLIPYVGFLIYMVIVIPTLESIGNYSLGLLYSNIVDNDPNLDKFEREIELLKYFD